MELQQSITFIICLVPLLIGLYIIYKLYRKNGWLDKEIKKLRKGRCDCKNPYLMPDNITHKYPDLKFDLEERYFRKQVHLYIHYIDER